MNYSRLNQATDSRMGDLMRKVSADVNKAEVSGNEMRAKQLSSAKRYAFKVVSSIHKGHEFSLTLPEYEEITSRTVCGYTGVEFDMTGNPSSQLYPTLERMDPFQGYVPGNVINVTYSANTSKGHLDAFEKDGVIPEEKKVELLQAAIKRSRKRIYERKRMERAAEKKSLREAEKRRVAEEAYIQQEEERLTLIGALESM